MTLLEIARMTDDEAREYLENIRWPNGPVCPHCGSRAITHLGGEKHRKGTIQCNNSECRQQFTVTVNTVMESSHIPINKWVLAFHLLCSSKKGISALQLQRELDLGSYRSAWFMAHRIRHAMDNGELGELLEGTVEVDETYMGGKSKGGKRGRGSETKTPVIALVERDGKILSKPIERVNAASLKGEIRANVDPSATIMTDEWPAYKGIGSEFEGGHHTVSHAEEEYSRKEGDISVHVNTSESFFALIKRGHYGVYHHMSKKHLFRYCHEFSFRWDHRKINDGERTEAVLSRIEGKRLMYRSPKSH